MDLLIAFLMGAVCGVTGFLPVSSFGHMLLIEKLAGSSYPPLLLHAFSKLGVLIAAASVMRKDLLRIALETAGLAGDGWRNLMMSLKGGPARTGRAYKKMLGTAYRRLAVMVLCAAVSSVPVSFVLHPVAVTMANSLLYTGIGMMLTGIILLVTGMVPPRGLSPKDIPVWKSVLSGAGQGFAALPGLSFVGITMSAGVFCGYSRRTALRVTWMMFALPALFRLAGEIRFCAASGAFTSDAAAGSAACFAGSLLFGLFFAKKMIHFVREADFTGFAVYSLAAGGAAVLLNFL